jgi:hypothetical protein
VYERKNMVLNGFWFEELIMGSSFLVDIDDVAIVGDVQGTLKGTHFPLPLPSSGIFHLHRFVQGLIDVRQIGLSSYVLGQRLLLKVQCTTQLSSVASNGHGAMLQLCRSEEYDYLVSRLKKQSMCGKHKLSFRRYFSCPAPTKFIIAMLIRSYAIIFFSLTNIRVLKTDKCGKEHLPSKNHEITKLDKSLSVCSVDW